MPLLATIKTAPTDHLRLATSWLLGIVIAFWAVGNPVSDGARLNLDLVAIGNRDVPPSLFAMGVELPRFPPYEILLGGLPNSISDATIAAALMIAIVAIATAGMAQFSRTQPLVVCLVAGAVYGLSPLMLTRLAVGHLGTAMAFALLPWAFKTLCDPFASRHKTGLWLAAFATCGYYGALVALPVVVVGAGPWNSRNQEASIDRAGSLSVRPLDVAWMLVWQIPWLVPAVLAAEARGDFAGSDAFTTELSSVRDAALLPLGHGFWLRTLWVGSSDDIAVGLSLGLVALAIVGVRRFPAKSRRVAVPVAAIGLIGAVASAVPTLSDGFDWLTRTAAFSPIRESHKLIVFFVFAVVIMATYGATEVGRWLSIPRLGGTIIGVALAAALVPIASDGRTELREQIAADEVPASWHQVVHEVSTRPGTTLTLPWSQYFTVDFAGGRASHNPLPFFLPGDLISRHDLNLPGEKSPVPRDLREGRVTPLLGSLRIGVNTEERLTNLGITWIVALPEHRPQDIDLLRQLSTLTPVVDADEIVLFRFEPVFAATDPVSPNLTTTWNARSTLILAALLFWVVLVLWTLRVLRTEGAVRADRAPLFACLRQLWAKVTA